jgi:tetratricopeptide (TPR) repeat protein
MLTYWINYDPAASTLSYHLTNVFLHAFNAFLVFCLCERLFTSHVVERTRALLAAALATLLFLLHPLQTESVAYVAGRSEVLSATFVLLAWLVYVRRIGRAVAARESCLILGFFALACASKEQAAATIPAVLLLTDWAFGSRSLWAEIKWNWRLYAPLAVGAALGASAVAFIIQGSGSAGSGTGVSSLDYFLTQCRALFVYLGLFVFPVGQNADRDFALSHHWNDYGAVIATFLLVVLIIGTLRQRPLIRYGTLLFFAFLAPTSSLIPLADPFAEHRMYLPVVGLAIVLCAMLAQSRISSHVFGWTSVAVVVLAFSLTAQRAAVWSDAVVFWKDVVAKSPAKDRGYSHLINAYILAGRCNDALDHLHKAGSSVPQDYFIKFNWAQAYACAKRPNEALDMLKEAERLNPTADVYGSMGDILWGQGRTAEAQAAYTQAIARQEPGTDLDHVYRGNLALLASNRIEAEKEYQNALAINPYSPEAIAQLRRLQAAASRQTRSRSRDFPRSTLSGLVDY